MLLYIWSIKHQITYQFEDERKLPYNFSPLQKTRSTVSKLHFQVTEIATITACYIVNFAVRRNVSSVLATGGKSNLIRN